MSQPRRHWKWRERKCEREGGFARMVRSTAERQALTRLRPRQRSSPSPRFSGGWPADIVNKRLAVEFCRSVSVGPRGFTLQSSKKQSLILREKKKNISWTIKKQRYWFDEVNISYSLYSFKINPKTFLIKYIWRITLLVNSKNDKIMMFWITVSDDFNLRSHKTIFNKMKM